MTKKKPILVLGAGSLSKEVFELIEDNQEVYFFDDTDFTKNIFCGKKVFHNFNDIQDKNIQLICAVGNPSGKFILVKKAADNGFLNFINLIDQSVLYSKKKNHIGKGTILLKNISLTVDIKIGEHVLINPGVTIAHDCEIDDFCSLGPGVNVAGKVRINSLCDIGVGVNILPNISIGKGSVIGAGSLVNKDISDYSLAYGVPAKIISQNLNKEVII